MVTTNGHHVSGLPLLRFGVVADVQYADNDDKQAWYDPRKTRFYRNSLKQVEKAFQHWEQFDSDGQCPVTFILQLGDIIDALSSSSGSQIAIERTLSCFLNNPHMPTFHTVGNHELYNFNRHEVSYLFEKYLFEQSHSEHPFNVKQPKTVEQPRNLYYKFSPRPGVKLISLDTYDISVLGYEPAHPKYALASDILQKYHGHVDFELWDSDQYLNGSEKRFQSSNGALSEEQLSWLESELEDSDRANEIVIVFGHVGLHPQSCNWDSILWNYDQVMNCFHRHSSVVAYFSGHAHNSGYAVEKGIHYVVFHGVIESDPNLEAFATVSLYQDHLYIDGKGVEQQLMLKLNKSVIVSSAESTNLESRSTEENTVEEVHMVAIEVEV